jgi:hypothetical protein
MLSEEKSEKERCKYQAGTRAENESAKDFWSVRALVEQRGGQLFESPDNDVKQGRLALQDC